MVPCQVPIMAERIAWPASLHAPKQFWQTVDAPWRRANVNPNFNQWEIFRMTNNSYWKSPFLIGKQLFLWQFSIAMLNYQRVITGHFQDPIHWRYLPYIRPKKGLCKGISPQNMAKHMVRLRTSILGSWRSPIDSIKPCLIVVGFHHSVIIWYDLVKKNGFSN